MNRGKAQGLLTLEEVIPGCLNDLQVVGVIWVLGLSISCREETVGRVLFSPLGLSCYARYIFQSYDPNSLFPRFLSASQASWDRHTAQIGYPVLTGMPGPRVLLPAPLALNPSPSEVKGWARRSSLCPVGYGQSS